MHIDIKPSAWNGLRSRSALRWAALLGATLVMLAVPAPRATAQAPAAEPAPVLLTEIGAHSAPIRRLSVDVPRGLVLTASDDRTARLWSLDTGALVRTLRPPVSGTRIGRLYGAALHPSRPIAAVAGTTGEGAAGAHSIYLFDLDTGRMQRRIDARAGDIKRLVWSADGSVLFAAYAGADGVRAFSAEGALLFEQTLRGASYGLSAAADGTVAVATLQGDVLVVKAANGRIEAVRRFNIPTASPVGIALSPDGTRLAVGSFLGRVANRDSPAGITVRIGGASVDVIEVRSGSVLRTLTPPTLEEGNLMTVAWSGDGRTIFAGGTGYRGNRNFPLLRFDAETGRLVGEQTVASDSVQDLAVLPDGRVAFASFDGTWGTATPTAVNRYGSQALDFVRAPERLSIAADGRRIRWQPGVDGAPLEFDFDKRTLGPIEAGAAALAIGPTLGSESNRGQWLNNERPSFAGAPIRMDPGEVNRAIAELRGTRDRIYGTSFALMRVRPDGSIAWRRLMDAETRALVVNADGTQVIGAMSDGSLRWWRTADGEPTLGLLGTRDRRWIAWTPNGFYDASTAADRLAGWAISRRIDRESEFFPLNRFRDRFNRPDVIDQVLITADGRRAVEEAERIAQAGREQAPEPPPLIVPAPLASAQAEVAPPVVAPPAVVPPAVTPPVASPPVASPPVASPPIASPPVAAPPVTTAPLPPPPIAAPTVPAPPIAAPPIAAPPITAPPVTAPARPTPPPIALPAPTPTPAPPPVALALPAAAPPRPPTPIAPPRVAELPPALVPVGSGTLRVASSEVVLPFAIRAQDASSQVTIEVRVNGRPVRPDQLELPNTADGDARGLARLRVDEPDALVQLIARNRDGTSEPLDFRIERIRPPTPPPAAARPRLPTLYVLSIGVSDYQRREYNLQLASKDANDFANAMRAQQGKRYGEVVTRIVTDKTATRAGVLQALQWLATASGPNDVTMLFVAGHGVNEAGGQYYFLPHDGNAEKLRTTGVPETAIRDALGRIRGRALFFIDTCFAGKVLGDSRSTSREISRLANELAASENGVIVFAASTGRQESIEIESLGNGAFTKALIDGLNGAADFQKRGRVTYKQLDAFVSDEVARITRGRQTPVTNVPVGIPDFEIARLTL